MSVKIKGQHSQEAKEAVDTIAKLYVIEKETAILTSEERYKIRQE